MGKVHSEEKGEQGHGDLDGGTASAREDGFNGKAVTIIDVRRI